MSGTSPARSVDPAVQPGVDDRPSDGLPRSMTIVYDGDCAFCRRCAQWLVQQQPALPTAVVSSTQPEAQTAYGHLEGFGQELVVVADSGQVWSGPDAFIVAMWCLAGYRSMSLHLSGPVGHRAARAFFHNISANRSTLGEWLDGDSSDPGCVRT